MARLTPKRLLRTADTLVPSGRGRPAQANLRRAISTAYYAVFCALGDQLVKPYHQELRHSIRRLLSHSAGLSVLGQLTSFDSSAGVARLRWHPGQPICDRDLLDFAKSFRILLDAREAADYDHRSIPTKRDARKALDTARLAIDQLNRAARNSPEQVQAVCVAMIASDRTRKRLAS